MDIFNNLDADDDQQSQNNEQNREESIEEQMERIQMVGKVVGVSRRKLADSCFKAVAAARFRQTKFLLNNGVSPNTRNDLGQNLLVAALHIPDPDKRQRMVTYLLSRGVPCGGRDDLGRDVLTWTCILGFTRQLEQISTAAMGNVDLSRQDKEGMMPLHHAVRQDQIHIVRILITMMNKFRLSVDVADVHGLTPYLYARRLGHYDIADVLVKEGRASKKQFDSQTFHNADEWAIIGAQERKEHDRNAKQRQLALYKIRGRLPPMEHKVIVPRIRLPSDEVAAEDDHHEPTPEFTGRSMDTALTLLKLHPDARIIAKKKSIAPIDHVHAINHSTDHLPDHFQRHTCREAIPSIMDILADQRCPSYRPQAKVTLPPPKDRRTLTKGKLSTLAIVMKRKHQATDNAGSRRMSLARQHGPTLSTQ